MVGCMATRTFNRKSKYKAVKAKMAKGKSVVDSNNIQIQTTNIGITPNFYNMPDATELEIRLKAVTDTLGVPDKVRKEMLKLPPDKKWEIILQHEKSGRGGLNNSSDNGSQCEISPDKYITELKQLLESMQSNILPEVKLNYATEIESKIDHLKTALRTQPAKFCQQFIDQEGFNLLLNLMQNMTPSMIENRVHASLLGCIKCLLYDPSQRKHILAHPSGILIIASISLPTNNLKTKILALEILSSVCILPGGHQKILEALTYLQDSQHERTRFSRLISDLDHDFPNQPEHEIDLKRHIMMFINTIMKGGLTTNNPSEEWEKRVHLRYELLCLGISPILDRLIELHGDHNPQLSKHVQFFQEQRFSDETKLATSHNMADRNLDSKSSSALFHAIRRRVSHTEAWQPFMSVLLHFALLPVEIAEKPKHWLLIDKCIQSIVMMKPDNKHCDVNYLSHIDLQACMDILGENFELKSAKATISKLKSSRDEYKSTAEKQKLNLEASKRERDSALRTCEKANSRVSEISSLNTKLESELISEKSKKLHYKNQLDEINKNLFLKDQEIHLLKQQLASLKLNQNSSKSSTENSNISIICTKCSKVPTENSNLIATVNSMSAPPPPPLPENLLMPPPPPPPMGAPNAFQPPSGLPPPPPPLNSNGTLPPPPNGLFTSAANQFAKTFKLHSKSLPKPKSKLKALNWQKLPEHKLKETVWNNLNEEKLFNEHKIDLEDFENKFSAYDATKHSIGGSNEGLSRINSIVSRGSPLSPMNLNVNGNANYNGAGGQLPELCLVDSRRSQNCAILLSRLKMDNRQIKDVLLSCDFDKLINKEMFDQLKKYMPTDEEVLLLNENVEEVDRMAKADRFMFEVSSIDHFKQRINCISYEKHFRDNISELKPKIELLNNASLSVLNSKRFHSILEYILAFGNYMNKGARGNAYGFKLSSLVKLADTKSSKTVSPFGNAGASQRSINLCHYLASILPSDILQILNPDNSFYDLLLNVQGVTVEDVQKDLKVLENGHTILKTEITYLQTQREKGNIIPRDDFLDRMKPIQALVNLELQELKSNLTEGLLNFNNAKKYFVIDSKTKANEFFSYIFDFIKTLSNCKDENEAYMEKIERESKKSRVLAYKKTSNRLNSSDSIGGNYNVRRTSGAARSDSSNKSGSNFNNSIQSNSDNQAGDLDDLLSVLKSGDYFDAPRHRMRNTRHGMIRD